MTGLLSDIGFDVTLKRSPRRRTIAIKVHRGQVQVSAPVQAPLTEIHEFVKEKKRWIQRHLQRQQEIIQDHQLAQYQSGETLFWLNQPVQIAVIGAGKTRLENNQLLIANPSGTRQERAIELANWFIDQAVVDIPPRVERWSEAMGLTARGIKIRHYKSRWGSCDRQGRLQFNWLIMMAPESVIDYVVVHELAHLKYFNHSSRFWTLVECTMPDYSVWRQWLKQQSHLHWQIEN